MATRHLYLVRHGQYETSGERPPKGNLTSRGRRQADRLLRAFRSTPIDVIHTSTLPRAVETGAILAASLPAVPVRRHHTLRECLPGVSLRFAQRIDAGTDPAAFLRTATAGSRGADRLRQRQASELRVDGERLLAGEKRSRKAFRTFVRPARGRDRHDVLVCHGNIIRALVCLAIGAPLACWMLGLPGHVSITRIRVLRGESPVLDAYNDVAHVPASMRSA